MRPEYKFIKELLESWGAHKRRSFSALGLPRSTPAFDPENYEYVYAPEPSWKRKRILPDEEKRYRRMRQRSTKPSMQPRVPNYISNKAMNYVDILIEKMPKIYKEVAEKKFKDQLKDKEIAVEINRTEKTVEKRVEQLYKRLYEQLDRRRLSRNPNKTLIRRNACLTR